MTQNTPSQETNKLLEAIRNVSAVLQHKDMNCVPEQRIHNTVNELDELVDSREGGASVDSLIICIGGALLTGCSEAELARSLNHIHTKPEIVLGDFQARHKALQAMVSGSSSLFASYKYWQALYAHVLYAMEPATFDTALDDVCNKARSNAQALFDQS